MSDEPKLSPVEIIKQQSHGLRGPIPAELRDGNDFFGKDSIQLLKHHGTYQQDDRDARAGGRVEGHKGKSPKAYSFMVRTKIPGGKLTSDQLLAELDLRRRTGATVLNIVRNEVPLPTPDGGTVLEAGDLLVLYGPHEAIDRACRLFEPKEATSDEL